MNPELWLKRLQRLEDSLLVVILLGMLFLAFSQIVMRNLFSSGMVWSEPLLKILVLWTAMLGAMVATRQHHHINIDVLTKFLPERYHTLQQFVVNAFSALVCWTLAWQSVRFVQQEWQDGTMAFGSVPAWVPELILPLGFFSMGLRFLLHCRPHPGGAQ